MTAEIWGYYARQDTSQGDFSWLIETLRWKDDGQRQF